MRGRGQEIAGEVGHDDQVAQFAVLVLGVLPEEGFMAKAQLLEHTDRRALIDGHLYHDLVKTLVHGLRQDLVGDETTLAAVAKRQVDDETQFTDML